MRRATILATVALLALAGCGKKQADAANGNSDQRALTGSPLTVAPAPTKQSASPKSAPKKHIDLTFTVTDSARATVNGVIEQLSKSPSTDSAPYGWSGYNLKISPTIKLTDGSGGECETSKKHEVPIYGTDSLKIFLHSHINETNTYSVSFDCPRGGFVISDLVLDGANTK
jgi:hypothetical protein